METGLSVGRMQEDNFVPGQPPNRRATSFTQPNLLELDFEIKSYNLERLVIALGGVSESRVDPLVWRGPWEP